MTPQNKAELEFWRGLVDRVGKEYYAAYRIAEYQEKMRHFPGFANQEGHGLDIGCGCVSIFEASSKPVTPVDVLVEEYKKLVPARALRLLYSTAVNRLWTFDWVACLNMIDHTPDWELTMIEIKFAMKPGAKLYFEVNLEAGLAPPHHEVWDKNMVSMRMVHKMKFVEESSYIEDVPEHNQQRYWAVYTKAE